MAKRLSVSVGMKFDDIGDLKKEAQGLLDKLGKQVKLNIGNVDLANIENAVNKLNKKIGTLQNTNINLVGTNDIKNIEGIAKALSKIEDVSKYKVELMADGQVKVVTEVNNQLKETVKVIQNLSNGNKSISISSNVDKEKKNAYNEIIKLQKTEYDLKNKLISADGEYAKVIQEQINYAQQLQKVTKQEIDKTNLSDAKMYNEILKERSVLESKLNLQKSKVETSNTNKFNQELLKQNDYLDKAIAKLKLYQQSVKNSGNGKPTQQADLSSEITRQIGKIEELKNSNNLLGTAEKNRINSTISQMRLQTNELVKYESSFSNLFKKMSMYALGGGIIYNGISEVKKGINNIIELDTAMRDLTKVAKATQQQLDEFTSVANRMAIEVGASTEAIIEATTYYSKLGYSITEASERAKNATIFSNVGDMGIEDATKALITIQKGFNLNSLEDMTRIMDVANEVGNNYTSTAEDVAEGLRRMGNAMYEAGNSYEQSVGLFVAGNASIQDAEVVGNAIKTITMRMRGMETEIDDTSIPVSKLRDEIKQLTADAGQMVDIMIDDNTFKSTYDQMTELAEVYPKLTDGQRSYLQYVIAGQRQGNIFSGMMANMAEGVDAYNTALNSSGSAMAEQERYMDSIEGKINKFTETLKSVWVESISSDTVKSIIDMGTSVVEIVGSMSEAFGLIPTTIGIATTAIILFNKEMYKGFTQNIPIVGKLSTKIDNFAKVTQMSMGKTISNAFNKFAQSMTTASAKATVLTAKNGVLAVSFKAVEIASALATGAMTLGLSFAIQAVISGIVKLVDNIVNADDKLKEFNETATQTVNDTTKAVAEATELLSKKIDLENSIANSKSTEDRAKLEAELLDIQQQLAGVLPQSASGFDSEGNAISASNSLIEESIRLKKEEMELSALSFIEKNKNIGSEISKLDDLKKQYEEMKLLNMKGESYTDKALVPNGNGGVSEINVKRKVTTKELKKMQEQIQDIATTTQQAQVHVQSLLNSGYTKEQINAMGIDTDSIDDYITSLDKASDSVDNAKANSNGVFDGITNSAEEAKTALDGLIDSFGGLEQPIKLLQTMIEEFSEYGMLSDDTFASVIKSGNTELIALLSDNENFLTNAQSLLDTNIQKQEEYAQQAIQTAVAQSGASADINASLLTETEALINAENAKMGISGQSAEARVKSELDAITTNAKNYGVDSNNFISLVNAKIKAGDSVANALINASKEMVSGQSANYNADASNFADFINSKLSNIEYYNAQLNKSFTSTTEKAKLFTDATEELQNAMNKSVMDGGTLPTSVGRVNSGYVGSGGVGGGVSHGSLGSGNSGSSGSSGSSSTAKEVADIELKIDRYRELQIAIDKVNEQLQINSILSKNATDSNKLKYAQEEIKLLNQKRQALENIQKAQKQEQSEIKNYLSQQGFGFNGSGEITNYSARMKQLQNWANSASGDEKESRQSTVKKIEEMLSAYDELRKTVADTNSDILDIQNTIIDAQKEIADVIQNEYQVWKENEEKKTSKLKEELQKRKDLMTKEWDNEDYQDKLDEEQGKLNDLMSQRQDALRTGDKELIASLDKQIQEQQKAISDIIRDQERNEASDKFDEVMDNLEKELEAKLEATDTAMSDEELLKKVQGGATTLSQALEGIIDVNDTLKTSVTTVGYGISMWNDELNTFISNLNSVNPNMALGLNINDIYGSLKTNQSPIVNIENKIEVAGGTCLDANELNSIMEANNKEIIKEINNSFKR